MGRWLWAGILPAQLLCEPRPVLSLSKGEIYAEPGKSQQRARSSERKGLRNRCKPDPGLLLQLCAAGRDLLLPFAQAAAGALAEGGTQNTLALLLLHFLWIPAPYECMELLFWGHFNAGFQYPKGQSTTWKDEEF